MVSFFPAKEILFYTLRLDDEVNEELSLRDLLEDKICRILNLPRDCEYQLIFNNVLGNRLYACCLINQRLLQKYSCKSQTCLTHPLFYTQSFIANKDKTQSLNPKPKDWNFFLVGDCCFDFELNLVGYFKGEMIFLEALREDCDWREKIIQIKEDFSEDFDLFVWAFDESSKEPMQALFTQLKELEILCYWYEVLQTDFLKTLNEKYNFMPKEVKPPLRQYFAVQALLACGLGIVLALGYLVSLGILSYRQKTQNSHLAREIQLLESQKQQYQQEQSQKQVELENLKSTYHTLASEIAQNQKSLEAFLQEEISLLFEQINQELVKENINVLFWHYQKERLALLLKGDRIKQWFEALDKDFPTNSLQVYQKINEYYWIEIEISRTLRKL